MADRWVCERCNRELESDLEPTSCPCGSEDISRIEELSILERFIQKYLGDRNSG
ncbi:MAG: hypothetical protein ABEJ99_01775 [Candidatus Nanohaloarchaea archaeon]